MLRRIICFIFVEGMKAVSVSGSASPADGGPRGYSNSLDMFENFASIHPIPIPCQYNTGPQDISSSSTCKSSSTPLVRGVCCAGLRTSPFLLTKVERLKGVINSSISVKGLASAARGLIWNHCATIEKWHS